MDVDRVRYDGGQFMAVGGDEIRISEDGKAWTGQELVSRGELSSVSARPDEVVVRGRDYDIGSVAFRSVDGTNWVPIPAEQTEPQVAVQSLWPLEAGVGSGSVCLSRPGGTWTAYGLPGEAKTAGLAYGPGHLLAVGERGTGWISSPLVGLELLGWTTRGELRLAITGPAGAHYDVERSADLQRWETVAEVQTVQSRHEVLLADAEGAAAWFWRGVLK